MTDDPRVQQLLDEILDSGCTPESACDACPELLTEVRRRWRQMCAVEAQLDALFPTPRRSTDGDDSEAWQAGAALPRIPGYEVEAVLGRGGMGIVYKARQLRLKRPVALKMLIAGAYAGREERERFLREAEAVAGLRHANVVQVHGAGEHEGRPYFTMEYVEGGSLAQVLLGKPQPARQAAALVATLAEAIQVAHRGGIVHRDLKPANILLTADGTPKIADFGLARHFDRGPALTLSGTRLGTPSYMAPEQAIGKTSVIGPAADIYALGALLYEMLTGRPPFRAETAAETQRQVVSEEPVPPARLNPKVPRDLETICLKCLHKEPQRRYATAAALAEDLERFQRHEPIAARRAGLPERTAKWVRRYPTQSATLAACLALLVVLVGGGVWFAVQEARRQDAIGADLREAARLRDSARWPEARASLDRADRLCVPWADHHCRRIGQARRDLDLAVQLDAIRIKRVTRGELAFYRAQADREYREAFPKAGVGDIHDQPARVAGLINASAVRGALVSSLLDWAVCTPDREQRRWLLEVVRNTDSEPDAWRARVLDPSAWEHSEALTELTRAAPLAGQPVSLLVALGERLMTTSGDAVPFLRRVQQEHPTNFWANLILGNAMLMGAPREAVGYYRAALTSRPSTPVGYCAVADALRLQDALGEASAYYTKALELDPRYSRAQSDLGLVLEAQDQFDAALACYRKAVELDPDYGWAHHNLANALRVVGRSDEAHDHYRQVIRVDPDNPLVHHNLASVMVPQGRGQEAQAVWRRALDSNPHDHLAWAGYAELCLFLGQDDEYHRVRRTLLDRFGSTTDPLIAEPVSRACLLLPGTEDELHLAVDLTDRAIAAKKSTLEWIYPYFLFAKGLADYRQGDLDSAISVMEGKASIVMGPSSKLIIAMAQHKQGRKREACQTLARAVVSFDWSTAQADSRDIWIAHVLRREAEALILPDPPSLLRGDDRALDPEERLGLVWVYQSQGLFHHAARLYADAFASQPNLSEELTSGLRSGISHESKPAGRLEELMTECRFPAARYAAMAGLGLGKDATGLDDAERRRWRKQARDWVQADLGVWTKTLDHGSRAARLLVRDKLTHWLADPDFARLRDAGAMETLSVDERNEWLALWQKVDALLKRSTRP